MVDIDFLPVEYRQRRRWRQSQPWQVVAAVAIVGLLATAAITQHRRWRRAEAELAAITPVYETVVKLRSRLADVRKQLNQARAHAELYTYLHHPWPRSQLLAAMVTPLPDEITLQQVEILREPAGASPPVEIRPVAGGKSQDQALKSPSPAQRDLAKLRDRTDPTRTVVVLTGTAAGSSAVHRYLGALDSVEIFDKAELDWFESAPGGKTGETLRFRAVLAVQPGYGQLGGPTMSAIDRRPLVAPRAANGDPGRISNVSGRTR
jgi:hypothetical protein